MSVIWINVIYIGDANWDTYETPNYSSWAWKYICQAKNEICMKLQGEQWMASNHYSIKKQYKLLMGKERQVNWSRFVLDRYTQPKHILILLLAMQDILKTK